MDWTPVSKELPPDGQHALVSTADGTRDIAQREHNGWRFVSDGYFVPDGAGTRDEVLAWVPLPEAYKGEA